MAHNLRECLWRNLAHSRPLASRTDSQTLSVLVISSQLYTNTLCKPAGVLSRCHARCTLDSTCVRTPYIPKATEVHLFLQLVHVSDPQLCAEVLKDAQFEKASLTYNNMAAVIPCMHALAMPACLLC